MNYGKGFIQNIYFLSPYFVKNLISSYYGYFQKKERYGLHFKNYLDLLKELEYADNAYLIKRLDSEKDKFVEFACKNSVFYKEHCRKPLKFNEFKIINKNDLRTNREKITVDSLLTESRMVHTSGTSGSALIFPITNECFQREYAFRAMHYSWAGIDVLKKPRIATFSGHPVAKPTKNNPPFWVYDFANNWLLFSSYHISDEFLKYYVKELLNFQPIAIHGYPSSVYLIAQAFKTYGRKLSSLKAIFTASESLYDFQRKVIEDSFQVKVYNWYGNTEMCANIVECDKGKMHLKLEHSLLKSWTKTINL
jgi:phenylacetate-CoA ligase